MDKITGIIRKEEFCGNEWYFLEISIFENIIIDTNKFTNVDEYLNKEIECKLLDWDYTKKKICERYKVIGIINQNNKL